jgi:hypothetical protein
MSFARVDSIRIGVCVRTTNTTNEVVYVSGVAARCLSIRQVIMQVSPPLFYLSPSHTLASARTDTDAATSTTLP